MTTKREPVAFDLAEVGVRRAPVLSVPDQRVERGVAAASAQAVARMRSPTPERGFQAFHNSSSHVTVRPAVGRPLWMADRLQGESGSDDNSSITIDSSLKKEVKEGSPASAHWDRSAPMSKSLNRHEDDSALAQQARKAAVMYGSPLYQALRSNLALRSDEAQAGAHQSSTLSGTEPPSTHSAGASVPPAPLYNRMKENSRLENGADWQSTPVPQQQQQHLIQGGNIAAGHAFERPTGAGKHPSTAQLSIFYAGTVNVYDDVPVDKAQAIMLLAGTGSPWSAKSNNVTNLLGSGANSGRPFSTLGGTNYLMSRAGSPVPQMAAPYNSGPSLGAEAKLPNRLPVTTAVELPQARKASLARFLEKRKDSRVRKGPYTLPNDEAARNDALRRSYSRENSPSHPDASAKPPRPSLSPSAAVNRTHHGSKSNSPPETPPRRISMSEEYRSGHVMLARKECENSLVHAVVSRGEKLSPSR